MHAGIDDSTSAIAGGIVAVVLVTVLLFALFAIIFLLWK